MALNMEGEGSFGCVKSRGLTVPQHFEKARMNSFIWGSGKTAVIIWMYAT